MTRQERIDTSCAVGIVAVLLILLGNWIGVSTPPASAATSEPVSAHQPPITTPASDYDPDEGERIEPAELAEIAASLPPCAEEDSEGEPCYWDAQQRGNGLGRSFIWDGAEVVYTSN